MNLVVQMSLMQNLLLVYENIYRGFEKNMIFIFFKNIYLVVNISSVPFKATC